MTPAAASSPPAAAADLPAMFRAAMRHLAASVAIVVAKGEEGPIGMAATSLTSLTLDPPALIICVNRSANIHGRLAPSVALSVNLLASHQHGIAAAFGGGLPTDRRFSIGAWRENAHGLPALEAAQANLGCVIDALLAYGTHSIVVARVVDVTIRYDSTALIYQKGAYRD